MRVWKTVKVFVSSTFKDLELERDRLARTFQTIQERIFSRRLHLIPYDLRWREQDQEENLVRWCLEMVGDSQYFVGILGYRYGWCPPADAKDRANRDRFSMTEMEIDHALAFVDKKRRFFCFGDMGDYSEEQLASESEEDKKSLDRLKKKLRFGGERVYDYHGTREILDIIARELQARIDGDYPPGKKAQLECYRPRDALRELIEEKCRGFVGRTRFLQTLDDFCANGEGRFLTVHAVAGTGKSALLANFISRKSANVPLIAHFMSAGAESRSVQGVLLGLGSQLKELGLIERELESLPELLATQVRSALQNTERRLIVAIDGLDEMEDDGKTLSWLPRVLPPEVRVILTTRPVSPFEKLEEINGMELLELLPLGDAEIREIIRSHGQKHLELSLQDEDLLVKRAAGSPLFLKVALDEMEAGGLAVGQLEETVDALFRQILKRLQKRHGQKIISDYLGIIAAGRNGLAPPELREVLIAHHGNKASDDLLLKVHKGLANFVIMREKLLDFFHPEFERSIKMLLGKGEMRLCHRSLAEYFAGKGYAYHRSLAELPYQLQWGELYDRLLRLLSDIEFLEAKCAEGMLVELRRDFEFALEASAVPLPPELRVEVKNDVYASRDILGLLWRALEMDIQFLGRHPQCLFQSLWNRGYWYDCPEAGKHYHTAGDVPWNRAGDKFYRLVEHWREIKEKRKGTVWLKSLRPPTERLESPLLKTFRGHQGAVYSVGMSADDSKIVSGSYDGSLRVWDAASGECLTSIDLNGEEVLSVSISADGRKIVSGSADGAVCVWDAESGRNIAVFKGHRGRVYGVSISANGCLAASGAADRTVKVWDIVAKKLLLTLEKHISSVRCVYLRPDGRRLVSGSEDNIAIVWDAASGECLDVLEGHNGTVNSVSMNADGSKTITGSKDRTAKLWETTGGRCLLSIEDKHSVYGVCLTPDESKIVTGSWDTKLRVWDAQSGKCLNVLAGHEDSVFTVCVSGDGRKAVSGANDAAVRLWDLTSRLAPLRLKGHTWMIQAMTQSEDHSILVTGGNDAAVLAWDTVRAKCVNAFKEHDWKITAVCVSADKTRAVSASTDATLRVWDLQKSRCLHVLRKHNFEVWCVNMSTDGRFIASGAMDDEARVWDSESGECVFSHKGHAAPVTDVALSADGRYLISGSFDKTVQVWDVEKNQFLWEFQGHEAAVTSVAISPDLAVVASASKDETVRVWDTETGQCVYVLGHPAGVTRVHISDDGARIISNTQRISSADFYVPVSAEKKFDKQEDMVLVWDLYSGECVKCVEGNTDERQFLSPARYCAVARHHETVLEDMESGEEVAFFPAVLRQAGWSGSRIIGSVYSQVYFLELVEYAVL